MMFRGLRKLGNICCGQMFLNKIKNIHFFVSRKQNLCPQQMLRARANWETFVSATMCPQQCVLVCQGLKGLPSTLKRKVDSFLKGEFEKASFSWRISVDGRPNLRIKFAFTNFSCVAWTGAKLKKHTKRDYGGSTSVLLRWSYINFEAFFKISSLVHAHVPGSLIAIFEPAWRFWKYLA